ncbi:diacylglycerol/polyprenol kinase family protein [Legionella sp. D16C41]|uniref:diacylglycerol/polyprenol kinase family protein n=1 Tax=Legionella sp. D16C41 TaxID=3402688 RepID=UPI003AF44A00
MLDQLQPLTILFFIILYLTILVCLYILQKFIQIQPEYLRKFIHAVCGLTCLTYPLLFNNILSVIIIMGAAIGFFLFVRLPYLKSMFNPVLNLRAFSLGEIYFPISIILLFGLARENYLEFVIPVLVLSLADAAASIVGIKYHFIEYKIFNNKKSLSGSLAFFIVCLFCMAIPIYFSNTSIPFIYLLLFAIILTLLEGISSRGIDNLILPVVTYLMLHYFS